MNPIRKPNQSPGPAAPATPVSTPIVLWIGLDWADQKHFLVCRPTDGTAKFTKELSQKPELIDEFFLQLHRQYPHGRLGVCVEQSRGPIISALMKFDFVVLYPVNPRSLAEFRRVFKVSGAKSDPSDGDLLADLGYLHHDRLRALQPQDVLTRQLSLLNEHRRDLVEDRTGALNRLGSTLKCYYPLALELVSENLGSPLALDFLRRWPNLAVLQKVKLQTVRAFFYAHNCRSAELIEGRLAALATAKPLTEDPGLIEPLQMRALAMVQQIASLQKSIAQYDQTIAAVFARHAKAALFAALPGAGPALAPRLAAAFGTLPDNWESAQDLLNLSGVAPVTRQSGKQRTVHFRWVRPKFLHQTLVEFAKCSLGQCDWAGLLYQHLLKEGNSTWMAIRIVAFKWVRILWRCWKENTAYDETRYLRGLQKRGVKLYESLYEKLPAAPQPNPVNKL